MKRRPTSLDLQLVEVNKYLETYKIKSLDNDLLKFWMAYLLDNGYYNGYNFFKYVAFDDGTVHRVLAGSSIDFDFLQLY